MPRALWYPQTSMRQDLGHLLPLADMPGGAHVLDLGCGSGTVAYAGYPQLRFFGSDQYADAGTTRWPPNAWLALADAEQLPYADGTFDGAICNFVFEHFERPRAALRELDRLVRPGGFLYVAIPRAGSLQDRLFRFALKGGGHIQRYTFAGFVSMVYQETGFKLAGYAPARGAFTWLRDVPYGEKLYRLLFGSFRAWAALGVNLLEASDYLMLFHLGERRGFRAVENVCGRCGSEIFPSQNRERWVCPGCSFENILVPVVRRG